MAGLTGHVTDPQGKPVSGARVLIVTGSVSQTAVSDEDGNFAFADVPAGVAKVRAAAPQFAEVAKSITVTDGQPVAVALQFDRLASRSDALIVTADVKQIDIE